MLPKLISCEDAERLMTPEQRARNRDPTSAAIRWAIEQVHRSVVEAWLCSHASHDNKVEADHDELLRRRGDTVPIQSLTYALWYYIDSGDDPRNAVGPIDYPEEQRAKDLLEAALQLISRPDPVLAAIERAPIRPPESKQERRLIEEALASGSGIPGEVVSAELAERGRRVVRAALERVICIDPVAFTGDAATGFQSSIHAQGVRLFRLGSGPTREACQMEARRIVDALALALPDALTEAELREHEGVTEPAPTPTEAVPPALDLSCSFCARSQQQVKKLVTGPSVHICNECIELCNDIMQSEEPEMAPGTPPSVVAEDDNKVALALIAKGNPVILKLQEDREAQGREQGREEGRMEGEAKGLRTAVRSLCRVLSIPLSAELESDLARTAAAELDALCERIQRDQHRP